MTTDRVIALPRRGVLGVAPGEATHGGVRVERVAAGTPAEGAGIRAGDVLLGIDGRRVADADDVRVRTSPICEGDAVLLLVRGEDGGEREVVVEAKGKPIERHEGCDVAYDAVVHEGARLRRILTLPAGARGPVPWVFYVQGHGAASVDGGAHPTRPLPALAAALARRGFGFVRVDRSGAGDSEGPSMRDVGLAAETAMCRAALLDCRRHPALRGDGVLLAHSLGGVVAAALAADVSTRPAGMIVYGGGAKTWTEYFDENCRRQWSLAGVPRVAQDGALRSIQRFHALAVVAGRPLDEVRAAMPEVTADPGLFGLELDGASAVMRGRPLAYWREVQEAPVAAQLASAGIPVLAAWGTSDWLASREDHHVVAACVCEGAPGLGEVTEVEGADHFFAARETPEESFAARDAGELATSVVDALVGWMERRL